MTVSRLIVSRLTLVSERVPARALLASQSRRTEQDGRGARSPAARPPPHYSGRNTPRSPLRTRFSRETVTRTLAQFVQLGLVEVGYRRLKIVDLEGLRRLAQGVGRAGGASLPPSPSSGQLADVHKL